MGLRLDKRIATWYQGRVCYITDLRPDTVIKDEAIPMFLQQVKGATFVTTNVSDFWQRIPAHGRYGIVCVSLPNERWYETPELLRRLFRLPEFKTKAARMGKVVRVSWRQIQYYAAGDDRIHTFAWSD